jgi:hypothetical protein
MYNKHVLIGLLCALVVTLPAGLRGEITDIKRVVKCQKRFASAGANFARKVIRYTLRCTTEIAECQIQCEEGVFGPPCHSNPPPCCDPEDPESNEAFGECMDRANGICDQQTAKIASAEASKQIKITNACSPLTQEELCGAETPGLNFATLNAGCLALDPGYTCTLPNLIACVGGPLQRALLDQMSAVLGPRSSDAVAIANLEGAFPDIPVKRKVSGDVGPDLEDWYAITGNAGDQIRVRVKTRDDNGNGSSNLSPVVRLIGVDGTTPVDDTFIRETDCSVPNVCGEPCPQFQRTLPFSGTFTLVIQAKTDAGCSGGAYRLVYVSPGGATPVLVLDDVPSGSTSAAFLNETGDALD